MTTQEKFEAALFPHRPHTELMVAEQILREVHP